MDSSVLNTLSRRIKLLTVGNPKIQKGTGKGYATAGLHLSPAWLSGHNTCANHTVECAAVCLNTSARGAMPKVQNARLARTKLYYEDRSAFMKALHKDINQFIANAADAKLTPAFRLNLTSDIRWEVHRLPHEYPDVKWYDYTKIANRVPLDNYHLTFSFSGHNLTACKLALANGMNVATPFMKKPSVWLDHPTLDGDEDDLRFLDPPSHIVALKPKGRLRSQPTSLFLGDNHRV
jgi:hypothetical protein